MRILVTGATGLIGRRAVARLVASGHTVTALSRDPEGARAHLPDLSDAWAWRQGEVTPPLAAFACDAVLHLAGESVAGRWTAAKKARILESRREGTRELVAAIERSPDRPAALVSASAVGFYGERGDEELTEASPRGGGFLADVCAAWEAEAQAAEALGLRVLRLRFGLVLDADGGVLGESLPLARAGLGGPLGSGRQWWPWVHRDDVVAAIAAGLEGDASGVWNVAAPGAVRQRDFARALGRTLGRPAVLPAPAFALRLVLGGFADEPLLSRLVRPAAPLAAGFAFAWPELAPALQDLVRPDPG
jgi:uncharacterized protein (TIGR01777 family)